MKEPYYFEGNILVINRELTALDMFVKDFLNVFTKHSDYLIVSGFVSISTGRTRGTEDVDLLFPVSNEEKFTALFEEIVSNNFWCYHGDTALEVFDYVKELHSVRFARTTTVFPNMECIPINQKRKAKWFEFLHPQYVRINSFAFKIPPLEFEILYKELILKEKKDIEDAQHLRSLFSSILKDKKFKEYRPIVLSE